MCVCVLQILISWTIINSTIHNINFYELHNGLSGSTEMSRLNIKQSFFRSVFHEIIEHGTAICSVMLNK